MGLRRWCLALGAVQLCTLAVVATTFPGCKGPQLPDPDVNEVPSISNLAATPSVIAVGGRSTITGQLGDADGDTVSWSLALDVSSSAQGTFSPAGGSGNIAATFTATRVGAAIIRATANDGRSGLTTQTVTVTVREGGAAPLP